MKSGKKSLGKEKHKDKEKYRRLKKYKDGKKSKMLERKVKRLGLK